MGETAVVFVILFFRRGVVTLTDSLDDHWSTVYPRQKLAQSSEERAHSAR